MYLCIYFNVCALQLHRVFSRIRDHEEIRERGEDPVSVIKARQVGTTEDPDADLADAANSSHGNGNKSASQDGMEVIEGTEIVETLFKMEIFCCLQVCRNDI